MRLYRTSVKEDLNVEQVFNFLVDRYLAIINHPDDIYTPKTVGESELSVVIAMALLLRELY